MAKKRKKEKSHKQRLAVAINLETNFSTKSPPYIPM
jgi:hypothetical protein